MEHGVIYHKNIQKGMFVVMISNDNFSIFESYEINAFGVGDILSGYFSECGPVNIVNTKTLKAHQVVVQNVGLNLTLAIDMTNLP